MVNRNAKNGYKIVKKDHINVACELSLSKLNVLGQSDLASKGQTSLATDN